MGKNCVGGKNNKLPLERLILFLFFSPLCCVLQPAGEREKKTKRGVDRAGINGDIVGAGFRVGEAHKEEVAEAEDKAKAAARSSEYGVGFAGGLGAIRRVPVPAGTRRPPSAVAAAAPSASAIQFPH